MKDLQKGFRVMSEVIILFLLGLDGLSLIVSIFLPLQPGTFSRIVILDLLTSITVVTAYILQPAVRDRWNIPLVMIPFYFIGVNLLGMNPDSVILAVLNLIKVAGLFIAFKDLAGSVGEFIRTSRLGYGLGLFVSVLFVFTILFYLVESPVNPLVRTYEDSLWYVLQTITTVGYGDIIPVTVPGRLTGVIIMISAIASTSLITASATSTLLETLQREQKRMESTRRDEFRRLSDKLDELEMRLDRIEDMLEKRR
ncbi:potassium channel family protein [Methanothermobacter sp.]|uniref:potassium channel family protein n=1 Tax=Methanothermobacter sp. TaxID=1884223 RepID=UPI003C790044